MHWVNGIYTRDRSVSAICPRANLLPSHLLRPLMKQYPLQRKQYVEIGLSHPKRMGVSSRTEGERNRMEISVRQDLIYAIKIDRSFSGPWNFKSRTHSIKFSKYPSSRGFLVLHFVASNFFQTYPNLFWLTTVEAGIARESPSSWLPEHPGCLNPMSLLGRWGEADLSLDLTAGWGVEWGIMKGREVDCFLNAGTMLVNS